MSWSYLVTWPIQCSRNCVLELLMPGCKKPCSFHLGKACHCVRSRIIWDFHAVKKPRLTIWKCYVGREKEKTDNPYVFQIFKLNHYICYKWKKPSWITSPVEFLVDYSPCCHLTEATWKILERIIQLSPVNPQSHKK